MADSYLNKSGLSYFWTKIKNALSLKTDKSDFDLVDRYYRALVPVGTEITSNKNLNTVEFLSVGKYYCHNNATTATLTNCPTGGKAFMMEVFSPLSTTIDNETTGTWVYRTRVITSYEGKTWYQSCYSNETAGNWIYGGWQYMPNSGDVNNQIYANTNSKYGYVRVTSYNANDGKWVKIASMSHHARSNDNVNYTFRLDTTGSGNAQYRQSYTFGVGARMGNTSLGSVRFDYLDSEKFNFNGAPEFEDLVKVTRKWVAGSSSADHYIYFEIWVKLIGGWRTYWLHPTNMNYKGDYSLNQAFFRNSDEWAYSSAVGTSAVIGQETYLTDGYEEVPMVDARRGVSYLDPIFTTRQTTADAPEINGRGGIRTFVATASMTDRPADGNILHLDWDNTGGWDSQLLVSHVDSTNAPNIYARGMRNGTWGDWVRFIREDDMVSKVNRNAFYNTSTTDTVYKKVTISGFPSSEIAPHGVGAFIFTRKQFYVLTGVAGSGANERFYEIGTNENNEEPQDGVGFSAHIKLVYQDGNPPTNILYVALPRYGYCDIHSSGTITIEDSDSAEWESVTANITCHPILASLKKASGGDLGNITAGVDSQSYLEVKSITTATDIDTLKTTGLYIIGVSGCSNVPSGAGWGTIYVDWTIGTKYQIYINDGDAWKIWKRKWNSSTSSWGSWIKQVETADIKNGVLTIQKNGENVQTFSANQSSNATANIEVPTKVSDIENDLNFIEDDTTQVCDEGSDIELEGTTKAPLEIKKLEGNSEQATYSGKNLFAYIGNVKSSESGVTGTLSADGTITYSGILSADNRHLTNDIDITDILEDGQVYTMSQTESFGDACSLEIRGRKTGTTTYSYWSTRNTGGTGSFTVNKTTYDQYIIWIIGKTSGTTGWGSTSRTLSAKYMLEKGSPATSWEPYVGGKASPSPDYPQVIDVVTGRNVVSITGKNLFNEETITRGYEFDGKTGEIVANEDWWVSDLIRVIPGKDYTSSGWDNGNVNKYWFREDLSYISRTSVATYEAPQDAAYVRVNGRLTQLGKEIMVEQNSSATDFEPYKNQSYEVNLGKNLLNKEDVVVGALLVDGTIDSTNYPNCRTTGYIAVKPNTAYRVSGRTAWSVQGEYAKDKTFISRSTGDSFTTGPNTYYVRVVCVNSELGSMQFEAGSVATSFSDYFEPIELSGINEYIDYIWRDGEDFYIHREIGKYVFDGSETYVRNGTHNFQTDTPFADYLKSSIEDDMAISDKFIYFANSGGSISTLLPDLNFAFSQDKTRAQFRYDAIASPADFKAWMEDNQLTVYYVLLNPTEEKITNEGLIEQLKALWYASGYNGQTNILVLPSSGNATGSISICQYPSHMPVATAYQLGNVIAGNGLNIEESGRISINTSYVGNNITKISNSEIDIIMGVA